MSCADERNPLQHSGTSQQERKTAALQPAFVRIDEHDFPEWIVFASRFAQYLNYYNESNLPTNNWQPFFDNDIAAVLGSLAIQNISSYRTAIKSRLAFLRDDDNEHDLTGLKATLGSLFSGILTLSVGLDSYLFRLPENHPLRLSLSNIISQQLQPALRSLFAYYKGGRSKHKSDGTEDPELVVISNKDFPDWIILGHPVHDVRETVRTQSLSAIWLDGKSTLQAFFNSIVPDATIYGDEDAAPFRRIQHAANHNLFTTLLDQYLGAFARIISEAETGLVDALTKLDTHPPHYTLFLSFLHLFRRAKDELNTITARHLDFYYKRTLRLGTRPSEPNQVHLVAELAKGVDSAVLPQGTEFRAGKDSQGKEIFYALDEETTFNRAKVEKLMSVYRGSVVGINGQPPMDDIGPVNNEGRLFASPVANSADGAGGEITSAEKAWQPFVQKTFTDGALTSINAPKAALGFAISSPYLALAEGDREIEIALLLGSLSAPLPDTFRFDAWLTTPKKWLQVAANATSTSAASGSVDAINISISLDGAMPAISNWDPKVHGENTGQALPTLRIFLSNDDANPYQYDTLKGCVLKSVQLSVFAGVDPATGQASSTGLRQLILANEQGGIDPAKPFQPFGLSPKVGSAFMVGSEEFFKKKGASCQLRMNWLDLPANAASMDFDNGGAENDKTPNVSLEVLAQGAWRTVMQNQDLWKEKSARTGRKGAKKAASSKATAGIDAQNDFPSTAQSFLAGADASAYLAYDEAYSPYSVRSRAGFMRIVLEDGFGYDDYQKAYTTYLTQQIFGTGTDPGVAPYVPKLESISLHYSASTNSAVNTDSGFDDRSLYFYHLAPFGSAEQHRSLHPEDDVMLLPQVAASDAGRDSGELYIGLSNLKGLQAVNLLFGIIEGSSDPLTAKPDKHLEWSYLSNNVWKELAPQLLRDGTAQWIQTGIVSISIPEDASTDNTLLPTGYLWLRAAVKSATLAVCKLVGVDAQAMVATLEDNGNAPDLLDTPLAAGTISKLRTAVSAFKKIQQPYTSFGGRPAEKDEDYYVRISERLRHKDRAITIWDYQHLILEAFPALQRVKCLSHTSYEQLPDGSMRYNEMAPGHVTIITIPSLHDVVLANPLRPYTSERVLAEIDAFVRERISCHVQPHVVHPLFEEVALDFKLRLLPSFDDYTFYIQTLQEEITQFLTPWAYNPDVAIAFGGIVRKSVLINFIEERPYVDYISDVRMFHRTKENPNSVADVDEIIASTGMAILVSVPAAKHSITPIPAPAATTVATPCIDPYATSSDSKA